MKIKSAELWDRLSLLLGEEANALLSERPNGKSGRHRSLAAEAKISDAKNWQRNAKAAEEVELAIHHLKTFAQRVVSGEKEEDRIVGPRTVSFYQASYEYADAEENPTTSTIRYTAETVSEAIIGAIKFWIDRQRNYEEHFHSVHAVNVTEARIGPISDMGSLFKGFGFPVFEWQVDSHGMPLELYAVVRIGEIAEGANR